MKRVLIIEPYYGGSHKQFLLGVKKNVEADYTFLTLPARKWKMRMQLSAPWFAKCIKDLENIFFDVVLCSTFVDVAVLRAMVSSLPGWNHGCRFLTYYHENQFAYPVRKEDTWIHQFTAINYTTAMVSDSLAFNSVYNLKSFINNVEKYLKKAADIDLKDSVDQIREKSTVLYPAQDFVHSQKVKANRSFPPTIVWNHRWEHDKNPDEFFRSLIQMHDMGKKFRLVLLGQSFHNVPDIFTQSIERLEDNIIHSGFVASRNEYLTLLGQCDIVVSTAVHEFFGISVMEAIHEGCYPLVPKRLSYPELYPEECLYEDGCLVTKLGDLLDNISNGFYPGKIIDTSKFSWKNLKKDYVEWLFPST